MKSLIKQLVPPILIHLYLSINKPKSTSAAVETLTWRGNYNSWQEAEKNSIGYSDREILNKCKNALLQVKNGNAVYERDSVLFNEIQHAWPVLSCLENIALSNKNQLHVIDFGGSLGSSFFQNKHFLQSINSLQWIVVEQKHFVECGKKEFEDEFLKFAYSVEEVLRQTLIHCLFLSGVLQYLDDPEKWLQKLINHNIDYILIDRTSFIEDMQRLTVQNVPEEIYKASYPCWFFNEREFLSKFENRYELIAEFPGFADGDRISEDNKKMYWKGFFLKRKG